MPERRQAQRREPIEVTVRERVVEAHPLPWFRRNDLGNEIMRQYTETLNSTLRAYVDTRTTKPEESEPVEIPQLEIYLNDKISNPELIIAMAYQKDYEEDEEFFHNLEYPELLELIYASLDVNHLDSLKELVDPNATTPENLSGNDSTGDQNGTPKGLSTPDLSSPELEEQKS